MIRVGEEVGVGLAGGRGVEHHGQTGGVGAAGGLAGDLGRQLALEEQVGEALPALRQVRGHDVRVRPARHRDRVLALRRDGDQGEAGGGIEGVEVVEPHARPGQAAQGRLPKSVPPTAPQRATRAPARAAATA